MFDGSLCPVFDYAPGHRIPGKFGRFPSAGADSDSDAVPRRRPSRWRTLIGCILTVGVAAIPGGCQGRELRVGVSGSPPFVMREPRPDAAPARGDIDVAIGPIGFHGQVGVLLPARPPTHWSRLRPFFGVAGLSSVGVLLLSLFLVGNLIWLAERRRNPGQFPPSYGRGVGHGTWFALVTLTTAGRCLAGLWVVLTLLAVFPITAGLASAFTVSLADTRQASIREPGDLRGARLAVVEGTTSRRWSDVVGARPVVSASLEAAVDLLRQGRVDGVLFDQPALRYALSQHPEAPLRLAPFGLGTQTYGLDLPAESELRLPLDVSLLELHRSGRIEAITDRWLGS